MIRMTVLTTLFGLAGNDLEALVAYLQTLEKK